MVTLHRLLYKMVHFLCRFSDPSWNSDGIGILCLCPDSVGLYMLYSVPLKTHLFSYFPEHFKPTTQIKKLITKPFRTLGPPRVRADLSLKTIRLQSGFASHCIWQDTGQLLMIAYLISHFSQAACLKSWLFENSLLVTQCPLAPTIWTKMEANPHLKASDAA